MLPTEEAKTWVESIEFSGMMKMINARAWTEPLGSNGLRVWVYIDMPNAVTPYENKIHIQNSLDFKNLDFDPDFDVQSFKNAIYNQMERFVIHELREGMRIKGKPLEPPHGLNGEFLPKGKFMETPE